VFAAPLRTLAVVTSLIALVSFGLFALDEVGAESEKTARATAGEEAAATADPSPRQERARERAHGNVREVIDDANDIVTKPFAWVVESSGSKWVQRGVPMLLVLVVFGFGLGYLARVLRS